MVQGQQKWRSLSFFICFCPRQRPISKVILIWVWHHHRRLPQWFANYKCGQTPMRTHLHNNLLIPNTWTAQMLWERYSLLQSFHSHNLKDTMRSANSFLVISFQIGLEYIRQFWGKNLLESLGTLHTMAKGQEAVNFYQSNCKKPRVRPLDPSHYAQSPEAIVI
jgi:hypothetical protein